MSPDLGPSAVLPLRRVRQVVTLASLHLDLRQLPRARTQKRSDPSLIRAITGRDDGCHIAPAGRRRADRPEPWSRTPVPAPASRACGASPAPAGRGSAPSRCAPPAVSGLGQRVEHHEVHQREPTLKNCANFFRDVPRPFRVLYGARPERSAPRVRCWRRGPAWEKRWRDPDSNWGHHDFQSCALPTELSRRGSGA